MRTNFARTIGVLALAVGLSCAKPIYVPQPPPLNAFAGVSTSVLLDRYKYHESRDVVNKLQNSINCTLTEPKKSKTDILAHIQGGVVSTGNRISAMQEEAESAFRRIGDSDLLVCSYPVCVRSTKVTRTECGPSGVPKKEEICHDVEVDVCDESGLQWNILNPSDVNTVVAEGSALRLFVNVNDGSVVTLSIGDAGSFSESLNRGSLD